MNFRKTIFGFFVLVTTSAFPVFPQLTSSPEDTIPPSVSEAFAAKPVAGLGTGMLSFFGDLYAKNFQEPVVSRIGFELHMAQQLNSFLTLDFQALFGKLGANERQTTRNLNFQSEIRSGSVSLVYNFSNFLPGRRYVSPYFSLGIGTIEFLSKTDLLDQFGNKYYYWTTGAIKNLDETDPMSSSAYKLVRDYKYETDIREMDVDGFGKYPERSWTLPVGAGVLLHIHNRAWMRIGTTFHYTFTDYIDGVTAKSTGVRKGNSRNDMFMMSSFSLHFDLFGPESGKKETENLLYESVDWLAIANGDSDGDGVTDFNDSCHGTPAGAVVNAKGCPLDDDGDVIATYRDKQENTPAGSIVNTDGVAMTDEMLLRQYEEYNDSTGKFSKFDTILAETFNPQRLAMKREFLVQLGVYKDALPPDRVTKFLSVNDILSTMQPDSSTLYTAGNYKTFAEAEQRMKKLLEMGITDAKVIYKKGGKYFDVTEADKKGTGGQTTDKVKTSDKDKVVSGGDKNTKPPGDAGDKDEGKDATGDVIFRVQLGAYSKPLPSSMFEGIEDFIIIKTEDGVYKYMTGSFDKLEDADRHRKLVKSKGYPGAFVAAYKNGKRIPIEQAGAFPQRVKEEVEEEKGKTVSTIDKSLVVFKVQIGAFRFDPVTDFKNKAAKVKGLKVETTPEGLIRYLAGSHSDYESAKKHRDQIAKDHNFPDAAVVAYYNNKFISVAEALELLKQ